MDSPRPSSFQAPSIWYAAVAEPQTNSGGKVRELIAGLPSFIEPHCRARETYRILLDFDHRGRRVVRAANEGWAVRVRNRMSHPALSRRIVAAVDGAGR